MEEFLFRKKIKTEWKNLQNSMIQMLGDKLRIWRPNGSEENNVELYQILEAADAALKAQQFEASKGMDTESGATAAAEKAIASLVPQADAEAKKLIAKKAAMLYIKQERERKKAIEMLDKAMDMLGETVQPDEPNPYLTGCVTKVKKAI